MLPRFPESPRWLLKHGKTDIASEIMSWQHETDPDDETIQEDIKEINEQNAQAEGKLTWGELVSNGKDMNLWRFCAACGSQAMQQISGINLVTYYSTVVFGQFLPVVSARQHSVGNANMSQKHHSDSMADYPAS